MGKYIPYIGVIFWIVLLGSLLYANHNSLSNYKLLCINNVEYVNTESGVTTAYNEIGEIKNCKVPPTLEYFVKYNQ